jgi:hypothetical protein
MRACVAAAVLLALPAGAAAGAGLPDLPSGQRVSLQEALWERHEPLGQTWLRLRFVAPAIGPGGLVFAQVEPDMVRLCEAVGLPMVAADGRPTDLIVVSLADRALAFGTTDPSVTQFFEGFTIDTGACIWDGF